MAVINPTAIRTAIAERLDGTLTNTPRVILPGYLSSDLAPGATDSTVSQRAAVVPSFTIALSFSRHADRPMGPGPSWIDAIEVRIRTHYLLGSEALSRVDADVVRSESDQLGYVIRAALEWPGSVAATSAAIATGIVSGCLAHVSSAVVTDSPPQAGQPGGGLYITEHVFTGAVFTVAGV